MGKQNEKETAEGLFQQAYSLHMQGDYHIAIELYQSSIKVYPTAEAYTFLGWAYSALDQHEKAIELCLFAIDKDPAYGNPYNDIGSYLVHLGRMDEAIPWLKKAIEAPRYDARHYPHYNLARIYERQGLWFEAIQEYRAALQLVPDYQIASDAIGRLQSWMN